MRKAFSLARDLLFTAIILMLAPLAHAQTVTLTASPSTGVRPVTPTLTWSTTPVATSCSASGGWAGSKSASGTEVLPAIIANTNYSLTCQFGTTGTATVNWSAPTTNINGTPLTDLAGFRVMYGTSATNLNQARAVNDPAARTTTITGLTAGTWYFGVRAVNAAGAESDDSNIATKTVSSVVSRTASASVSVTEPPTVPNPPTNVSVTISQVVMDLERNPNGTWRMNRHVANLPVGSPVVKRYSVSNSAGQKMCQVDRQTPGIEHVKSSKGVLVAACS